MWGPARYDGLWRRVGMAEATTALVTGGAGLIGSHIVDEALARGWNVRVLDNLEPQTHAEGKPSWIPGDVEFIHGDVRNQEDWDRALNGVDVVFHEAAYGGYMPCLLYTSDAADDL